MHEKLSNKKMEVDHVKEIIRYILYERLLQLY